MDQTHPNQVVVVVPYHSLSKHSTVFVVLFLEESIDKGSAKPTINVIMTRMVSSHACHGPETLQNQADMCRLRDSSLVAHEPRAEFGRADDHGGCARLQRCMRPPWRWRACTGRLDHSEPTCAAQTCALVRSCRRAECRLCDSSPVARASS